MKTFIKRLKQDDGFTLVELMVVVAIIGLLSAVAIPNFRKYQAKSKASEAKLQLATIYSSMVSWYSDYDNYASCLNLMGFDPGYEVSQRYYAVGFGATYNSSSTNNGSPAGCDAANISISTGVGTGTDGVYVWNAGKRVSGAAAMVAANLPATYTTSAVAFTAGAVGVIDSSKTASVNADRWGITDLKKITNTIVGY